MKDKSMQNQMELTLQKKWKKNKKNKTPEQKEENIFGLRKTRMIVEFESLNLLL